MPSIPSKSFCYHVTLEASLLSGVHSDVWAHQRHQLHLFIHTLHPGSQLQSIWANHYLLGRRYLPRIMLYLALSLSNTKTRCWLMHLFLSNLGNLKSCIVTTSWVLRQPARVLTSLASPSSLVTTPFGNDYLLIMEAVESESRSTQKSLWLCTVPIVSACCMPVDHTREQYNEKISMLILSGKRLLFESWKGVC
jgi:hypothetical protein